MRQFVAAAAQMDSGPDRHSNLMRMESLIQEAGDKGASLVVFPEMSVILPSTGSERRNATESIPGPSVDFLAARARSARIWVHCGSILERVDGDERSYNTSVLLDPDGSIAAIYRKIHLFDVDIDQGPSVTESTSYAPGKEIVAVQTDLGIIGLSICYDLRFPELFRILALRGAQLLTVPACFTAATGKEHWEPLLRARAIENLAYVIAPGQIGKKPRYNANGKSMIVDPWGTVIACKASGEGLILAEIDLDRVDTLRKSLPNLTNRRPETYRWDE
ncbi:MAG: hydrolase [Dethiosulfovibrio peptidovorans]|nr:MAG: hydrolase [Dethiosulfovibrio peptidovorans]